MAISKVPSFNWSTIDCGASKATILILPPCPACLTPFAVPEDVDYLLLRLGDHSVAGVRGVGDALPHDRGAHWLPYFSARDPEPGNGIMKALRGSLISTV